MKALVSSLFIIVVATTGCRQPSQEAARPPQDRRSQTLLDSAPAGPNVVMVRPKEAVRPTEAITDFDRLPTISQVDIDALRRTPSKGVVYVKRGEAVRPAEGVP